MPPIDLPKVDFGGQMKLLTHDKVKRVLSACDVELNCFEWRFGERTSEERPEGPWPWRKLSWDGKTKPDLGIHFFGVPFPEQAGGGLWVMGEQQLFKYK